MTTATLANGPLRTPNLNAVPPERKAKRRRSLFGAATLDMMEPLDLSLALEKSRLPFLVRLTIVTLSLATLGFVLWAALTPVKELAKTQGQVVPSGYSRLVQHLEGGLVRDILVHDGDFVKEGQLLMRLDGAGTEEDWKQQGALVSALQLQAARLRAQIAGTRPDFTGIGAVDAQKAEQMRMYDTMQQARGGERSILAAQITERQSSIARLQQALATANSNLSISAESLAAYQKLAEGGHAARMTLLKKQEEYNTAAGQTADLGQQIAQARNELAEYRQRASSLTATQRDTAYTELHKVEAELAQAGELQKKRASRVDRLEVHAPVTGYVKGLRVNTIGSVIAAGQTLMEIVPTGDKLVVETHIPPQTIGRIAVGQEVQVRVDSYDYVRYGAIPGTLQMVSATTFTDEAKHEEYYEGGIILQRSYAGQVAGEHVVMPGMTVNADIVVGEKSVLAYLFKPIHAALSNAMTEQ